jgi:hypothetical protein
VLAIGCALACYQDKPVPVADTSKSSGSTSLGLQPLTASHDTAIREIDRLQLTSEVIQRWAMAKRSMDALTARNPEIIKRLKAGSPPKNIDEMAARIDAEPQMRDALQQSGLKAKDYMVTSIALQQALHGFQLKQMGKLDAKRVPPIVMGNIDFVSTHLPQIMQAMGVPAALQRPTN